MNQIARVFIVVNLVLSVLYLGFAATLLSQKWDYREMYLEQKSEREKEVKRLKEEKQDGEARIANLRALVTEREKAAKEWKDKHQVITEKNNQLSRENLDFKTSLSKIDTNIKEINDRMRDKEARISELEKTISDQKLVMEEATKAKEEAQNEQQRLEIQLSNLQGEMAEKEKLLQRSQKELVEAKQIIRAVKEAGVNIPALFKRAKPLDGQIVAVSEQVPIVMINLGSDRGVEKGYQFTVFRSNQFIGRVTVEEVYKDMSAARIVKEMTVKAIKRGDNVTTRIGGEGSF